MRVIAGECKGLRLRAVPGTDTRPTTDRVKEAMFSILAPYLGEGMVLDLFAGTGALGIESLSRGMTRCVFVDQSAKAIQVIAANLDACRLRDRSEILKMSAGRALVHLANQGFKFRLVLIDPPYQKQAGPEMVQEIQRLNLSDPGAVYMIEHASSDQLPQAIGTAELFRQGKYGDSTLSFYREGKEKL